LRVPFHFPSLQFVFPEYPQREDSFSRKKEKKVVEERIGGDYRTVSLV
jgi:hypothetical protein